MTLSLPRFRRSPWLTGTLLLVLAAAFAALVVGLLGLRRWPLGVGLGALWLLLFGSLERLWRSRPLPRRLRMGDRSRFRVVTGGRAKGRGRAADPPRGDSGEDKPRWLM